MAKKGLALVILIVILAIVGIGVAYYLGKASGGTPGLPQSLSPTPTPSPEPVACTQEAKLCPDGSSVGRTGPNCEFAPCPTTSPTVKPGWKTYKNSDLGFELSHPDKYKVVDDKYGWPNAVVLLYGGGQSYDLAVEVWNSTSEYEKKYKTQTDNLTVEQVKNKYITLLNMNHIDEVDEIIATFKVLD